MRPRKSKRSLVSALVMISLWAIALGTFASGIARELEGLRLPV
ncbi:hypothetical protein [Streptomyces clavuligerus]|nr:hypothetical protein [Streptomyces clavuligerus]